jgi:hypothetical protein
LRAVVVIQPRGLAGRPSPGHLRRARAKSLLHRVLGDVDVTEHANRRGHRSARLLAEIRPTSAASSFGAARTLSASASSQNGRASTGFMTAALAVECQASAASRSSASM